MTFECVPWCPEAEQGLSLAAYGHLAEIKRRVMNEEASLYKVHHHGKTNWMTLYVEDKNILHIECYQGSDYMRFCKAIIQRAKETGFKLMRFRTQDPRIVNVWKRIGKTNLSHLPSEDDFYYEVRV